MNFLKASARRIEQGILEQLGGASYSRDGSIERDEARLKRLEDGIAKLSSCALAYHASLKRSTEDARDFAIALEGLWSSDMRGGVVPTDASSIATLDALQADAQVHTGLRAAVAKSMERMLMEQVVTPVGSASRKLAAIRKQFDVRRERVNEYDSSVRRLESMRGRPDSGEDTVARAEAKMRAASASLVEAKRVMEVMLSAVEVERAHLVRSAATVFVACQAHFHQHAADVVAALLPLHPDASTALSELALDTHMTAAALYPNAAAAADASASAKGLAMSFKAGMTRPVSVAFNPAAETARLNEALVLKGPFGELHTRALETSMRTAIADTVVKSAQTKAAAAAASGMPVTAMHAPQLRALSAKPTAYARPLHPASMAAGFASAAGMPPPPRSVSADAPVAPGRSASVVDVSAAVALSPPGNIATALYDFMPDADNELQLKKGDVVEVLERAADGWWTGRIVCPVDGSGVTPAPGTSSAPLRSKSGSNTGLFPYNYVQVLSPEEAAMYLGTATATTAAAAAAAGSGSPDVVRSASVSNPTTPTFTFTAPAANACVPAMSLGTAPSSQAGSVKSRWPVPRPTSVGSKTPVNGGRVGGAVSHASSGSPSTTPPLATSSSSSVVTEDLLGLYSLSPSPAPAPAPSPAPAPPSSSQPPPPPPAASTWQVGADFSFIPAATSTSAVPAPRQASTSWVQGGDPRAFATASSASSGPKPSPAFFVPPPPPAAARKP